MIKTLKEDTLDFHYMRLRDTTAMLAMLTSGG